MKKVTIILTGVILMTIASLSVNAQSSATASSTATLIIPISILKTTDLNFGTIAASATAGSVTMSEAGVATAADGVTLMSGGEARTTAVFSVAGEGTSVVNITYPITLELKNAGNDVLSMTNIGTSVAATGTTFSLVSGAKVIPFSAKLNVPANAVAGVYTSAAGLLVTVNYQ